MNILMLNTTDIVGGAAIAAYRLHKGLINQNIDSRMIVQIKKSHDPSIIGPSNPYRKFISYIRPYLDEFPLNLYPNRDKTLFSLTWFPSNKASIISRINPSIIHLHWINHGFLSIEELKKLKYPIVWTFHDMWPFTGGCHYSGFCNNYQYYCKKCPQLNSNFEKDISYWSWKRKKIIFEKLNLFIVCPSKWMATCVKKSSIFKNFEITIIPNGIDTTLYKPINKQIAREILNLPANKKLILFGAMNATSDKRKGYEYLKKALSLIKKTELKNEFELVIFGESNIQLSNNDIKINHLGILPGDLPLVILYSAVDIFVQPSIQENFANTVLESLSCGTPVVAFNIGGFPDLILHMKNGYLAEPFSIESLSNGILWLLSLSEERKNEINNNARNTINVNFDINYIAKSYIEFYKKIINKFD